MILNNLIYLMAPSIILLIVVIIYLLIIIHQKNHDNKNNEILIFNLKEKFLQIKNENLILQQKNNFIESQSNKMIEQFKSLSTETVASQSFSFIKVIEDHIYKIKTSHQEENSKAKYSIKEVLLPLENTIHNFEKLIHSFENKTSVDNREIFSKLSQVVNSSYNLQQEVNKVINSLRSPNVKGIWGEMQLKKLVQLCGMEEHCDFQWQSTIEKGLKPDMVINLPNNKQIIVDSKVSLSAYINCMDTNDDEKKKYYIQEHARQIKQHINSLYSKKYWEALDNSANFVILFLPGECFLSTALEVNPSMIEYATKYNIIIATPTTMIGLLKTIAYGWENIHITRDIEKIKGIIQTLHGDLSSVIDDINGMGKIIDSLNNCYKKTSSNINNSIKYTLEEITNKYAVNFHNNIKEDKLKKTKIPDVLKKESNNQENIIIYQESIENLDNNHIIIDDNNKIIQDDYLNINITNEDIYKNNIINCNIEDLDNICHKKQDDCINLLQQDNILIEKNFHNNCDNIININNYYDNNNYDNNNFYHI
jgi:DNA recombination protein RmuC